MTTASTPPASDAQQPDASPPASLGVVGLVTDRSQVDEAVLAAFHAQRDFSLTTTALQRRADRLILLKDGRAKVLGQEVKRTAKEFDIHEKGEPWTSYQVAAAAVRAAIEAGEPIPTAALNEALSFAPTSIRLYDAHKAAVKAKKDAVDALVSKINQVEHARAELLRRGIGARTAEPAASAQATLPNIDAGAPVTPAPWMDQGMRQVVYDTLSKEMRLIETDIQKAANGNDRVAQARAEQDKRQHDELLASLTTSGLLEGLTPDESDETVEVEPDETAEPEVEFHDEESDELEDATKHPALQPAIEKQEKKRAAKKTAKKAGSKRGRKSK